MHPPNCSAALLSLSVVVILLSYVSTIPLPGPDSIRPLICLDKVRGISGICMFSMDCQALNGTSLGVCGDRMFFGSCCVVPDDLLDDEDEEEDGEDNGDLNNAQKLQQLNALNRIAQLKRSNINSKPASGSTFLLDIKKNKRN